MFDKKRWEKEYRAKNKEKLSLLQKKWRSKNKGRVKEYQKKWYAEHQEAKAAMWKRNYAKNKEAIYERNRKWLSDNREWARAYQKEWHLKNIDSVRERTVKRQRTIRERVVSAYGGACSCCGERRIEFLTIDHVDGKGAEHRRELNGRSGHRFYSWLIANEFPKENYRLLCWNCNCSRYFFGGCPHEKERQSQAVA